jgi:hypothetical protein
MSRGSFLLLAAVAATGLLGCRAEAAWWKGNLHTHSFWSDGDDYPEMVIDWYKEHGYHFVQLSEHNTLAEGEKWVQVARRGGQAEYEAYVDRFGSDWVVTRSDSLGLSVRLKTFSEYRSLFDEPERFLVIQGEEITDGFESKPVHLNATNLVDLVPPQHGSSVREVIQQNVNAVLDQRARTGQPMIAHLNHPNYGWAVTAEDLIAVEEERFFEVYNGHPAVNNDGDDEHPGTERLWDIILAERLSHGMPPMFGIAVDDAHNYQEIGVGHANAGRGWIVVRAQKLTPDELIVAMEEGDFYSSTGVQIDDVATENRTLSLRIRAEPGIEYNTLFIGTYRGYPPSTPLVDPSDSSSVRRAYSEKIGSVLAEVAGLEPSYTMSGNELYVRAKVISSKLKANPYRHGELEVAWTQPVVPGSLSQR